LPGERGGGERYAVRRRVEVDGGNLTDARAGQDGRTAEWVVNFAFDSVGTRRFAEPPGRTWAGPSPSCSTNG
jgi:preprotein translocase subunit SecD